MSQILKPKKGYKKVKWYFGKEIEIPEEWKIRKLETLVDILDSKRIPLKESERGKRHGKYPYYGASGIIDYLDDYIFDEKLLCLAEDGENLRSKVLPIAFTIENKTWVNNHAHVLRVKDGTEHYFLEYSLNYLSLLKYVVSTAIPKLNQKDMCSIPIICPEISEQQKIASILFNIDNIINSTQKIIEDSKKIKSGLMQKLLIKGIGHTKFKKIKTLYRKWEDIPTNWELTTFKEITRDHKQGFYTEESYSTEGTRLIRISDLHNPKLSYETMPRLKLDKKIINQFSVSIGDFLFARTGASIGTFGILTKDIPCVFASYLIRFSFNQKIVNNKFLGYVYGSTIIQKQQNMIRQGSSNTNINAENIKSLKFLKPPMKEQGKIASILSNIDFQITSQIQYKEKLERLKKSLMQKLLTGEVRVAP